MYQHVIWDADGVLLNSAAQAWDAARRILGLFSHAPTFKTERTIEMFSAESRKRRSSARTMPTHSARCIACLCGTTRIRYRPFTMSCRSLRECRCLVQS